MKLTDAGIYDLINIFKGEPTKAHNKSQGGIINDSERIINIPAYQRPYRWGEDNIVRLFEDYDENRSEYFLGSAVVVEKNKSGIKEFDVVDGQQRMTTLFLLNYIRFLLKREFTLEKLKKQYQPKSSEYCNSLLDCYVNLIGKNRGPFDNILAKVEELSEKEDMSPENRVKQLISCYKKELCIPDIKSTALETVEERLEKSRKFFLDERLCLKYSRERYNTVLKNALCNVYLKIPEDTNNFELCTKINDSNVSKDEFTNNYLKAMEAIFGCIWSRGRNLTENVENAGLFDICENAIKLVDEIIENMSLCVVLTENENDANKLFEVLNDRALEVEDLELIKNHFYKEYCTKSSDSDDEQDEKISVLDEIWVDKIFNGNTDSANKLISYLAAVFLTCDKELLFKDDAKLKNAIEKNYSSKKYELGKNKYEYENVLSDFNLYLAIKIILDEFGVKAQKLNTVSLNAEQENKSITYKCIHLLNALKYHAILPAITNVIVSTYIKTNPMTEDNFESNFKEYIKDIMNDKEHIEPRYSKIHKCAYILWNSSIKAKNYNIPREIAKRIISDFGSTGCPELDIDLKMEEASALDREFEEWLNEWTYSSNKTFIIKVLLLNLLISRRTIDDGDGYNSKHVKINVNGGLTYKLNASQLQLDHLEAEVLNQTFSTKYYLHDDIEKRQKHINEYIGNFMILDGLDNNKKKNVPVSESMRFYKSIEKSWLIEDIEGMMKNDAYFDNSTNVPKEEFFRERTARLKKYFKGILGRDLNEDIVEIDF